MQIHVCVCPKKILFLSHSFYLWFFGWCVLTASLFTYVSIEFISFCGLSQRFQFSKPTITLIHIYNINTIMRPFSRIRLLLLCLLLCFVIYWYHQIHCYHLKSIEYNIGKSSNLYNACVWYCISSFAGKVLWKGMQ